jgi:hypothetical protein
MQTVNHSNSQIAASKATDRLPQIACAPLLQNALSSLDASLDEELERYRHWLENGQTFSYLNPFRSSFGISAPRSRNTNNTDANAIAPSSQTSNRTGNGNRASLQLPEVPMPTQSKSPAERLKITEDIQSEDTQNKGINKVRYGSTSDPLEQMAEIILDSPSEHRNFAAMAETIAEEDLLQQFFAEIPPEIADEDSDITDNYATEYELDENEDADREEIDSDRLGNYLENYLEDGLEEDEEEEYDEEEEEPEESRFNLFSHLSIATLLILLAASSAIGYAMLDPSRVARIFKPDAAKPSQLETSSTTDNAEGDPNLKPEPNPLDRDTLLAVPKQDPKLVPFVPLPGKQPQPGQSVKGFTTATPNQPQNHQSSTRKSVPNLSVPPLSTTTKTTRLSTPTALPPAILPHQPESTPPEPPRRTNTYVPPVRDTYVPPNRNNYVPPVRDTYTPPARPAPAYKSAPEPRPQVNTTPPAPRPRWKRPANSLPSSTSPAKTAGTTSPTPITPQALPPLKSSPTAGLPPVRYTAPISAAPSDVNSSSNSSSNVSPAIAAPVPAKSAGYKIVAPTRYLSKVQEIDKEAYVRPSGEVQLGAYQSSKAAQQRADELRRQGIPVQVEQQ